MNSSGHSGIPSPVAVSRSPFATVSRGPLRYFAYLLGPKKQILPAEAMSKMKLWWNLMIVP